MSDSTPQFLQKECLQVLLDVLLNRGYSVVGPTIDQEAVVYDEIRHVSDLPIGWTDDQHPGSYRLARRDDDAYFGYVVGPQSWKKYLFPPTSTLSRATKNENGWVMETVDEVPPRYALLGVRACELAAIRIQDKVFMGNGFVDPIYAGRRAGTFIIAVNCTQAASTCFCTSMNTGPQCTSGFDLALTELPEGFVLEVGTDIGREVLGELTTLKSTPEQLLSADTPGSKRSTRLRNGWTPTISAIYCSTTSSIRAGKKLPSVACHARTARWSARPVFAVP